MARDTMPSSGRRKIGSVRSAAPPEGLVYRAEILAREEERDLLARCQDLPLKEFEFQGYLAKRRVIYYGWQYRYGDRALHPAGEIPDFLQALRERVAPLAELSPEDFPHAMVTEYRPGTPIGWHRDKAVFGDVIGVSLLSSCVFRLRRRTAAGEWERYAFSRRTAVRVSSARFRADGVGAQHSGGRRAALLDHLPHPERDAGRLRPRPTADPETA